MGSHDDRRVRQPHRPSVFLFQRAVSRGRPCIAVRIRDAPIGITAWTRFYRQPGMCPGARPPPSSFELSRGNRNRTQIGKIIETETRREERPIPEIASSLLLATLVKPRSLPWSSGRLVLLHAPHHGHLHLHDPTTDHPNPKPEHEHPISDISDFSSCLHMLYALVGAGCWLLVAGC